MFERVCSSSITRNDLGYVLLLSNIFNDGPASEVSLSLREQFKIMSFYDVINELNVETRRKRKYTKKYQKFLFLTKIPDVDKIMCADQTSEYSQHYKNLVNTYPQNPNTDLGLEIQQFHSCYKKISYSDSHKFSSNCRTIVQDVFSLQYLKHTCSSETRIIFSMY